MTAKPLTATMAELLDPLTNPPPRGVQLPESVKRRQVEIAERLLVKD